MQGLARTGGSRGAHGRHFGAVALRCVEVRRDVTDILGATHPSSVIRMTRGGMDEFIKRLEEQAAVMWKTSGSRFLAATRLLRRERLSMFSIALLSVVATVVGLLDPHLNSVAHRF